MTDPTLQKLEAAAVPAVLQVISAAEQAFATIFAGDPATAMARAAAAAPIFLGQAQLAVLGGGASEFTAVGAAIQSGFDELKAKVTAIGAAAAAGSSSSAPAPAKS